MTRRLTTALVKFGFSLHPKNRGSDYVQGWNCIPIAYGPEHRRRRTVLEFVCQLLTGHEISETEWSYGGGDKVDGHCRWCDKVLKIPLDEARFRFPTFNNWGKDVFKNPFNPDALPTSIDID